jgi:hypothetical protein
MMMHRLISLFLAVGLAAGPPLGSLHSSPMLMMQQRGLPKPADVMVACVADTTDLQTYDTGVFDAIVTGRSDEDLVSVWVAVFGEDAATAFGVNVVNIDGGANFVEVVDEDGSGVVNTALYRANHAGSTSSFIRNTATVDLSVTFSETVTGAAACVFTIANSEISGAGVGGSGAVPDNDSVSGALIIDNTANLLVGKIVMGICGAEDASVTTTWTGITEQLDATNAEFSYSAAYLVIPAGTPEGTLAITCDYSGAGDASGAQSSSGF